MIISLLSENQSLINAFQKMNDAEIKVITDINDFEGDSSQVLIIDGNQLSVNEVVEKHKNIKDIQEKYYIPHEQLTSFGSKSLLEANDIKVTPKNLSPEEVKNFIHSLIKTKENKTFNKVVAFHGAQPRVGTTSIVHSIGKTLAQHNVKTLILTLDNHPNDTFLEPSTKSIDNLKAKMKANTISFRDIMQESINYGDQLFILPGPRDMTTFRKDFSDVGMIDNLMNLIYEQAEEKGFVILIDTGSDVTHSLSLKALERVQKKYLITQPFQSSYEEFLRKSNQVFEHMDLKPTDLYLILNNYHQQMDKTPSQIADEYLCNFAGEIQHFPRPHVAEEKETLPYQMDTDIENQVLSITKVIARMTDSDMQENEGEENENTVSIFGKMKSMFATL